MRGGGGAVGGALGGLKQDTFIDLDWTSNEPTKPFGPAFPADRLFTGETDGSSFPNGGLRETHAAAAFTTWDRTSPIVVCDKVSACHFFPIQRWHLSSLPGRCLASF